MTTSALDCRAVLFDLDGVLVDSTESVRDVLIEWGSPRGVDADELLRASHGRRFADSLRQVAPQLDATLEAGLLESMVASASSGVTPIRGARALVGSLPDDAWAVVTSASTPVALARMRHAGLPAPPLLISADHVARGKPDPEGYLSAAVALGVEFADCVVVEDAPAGVEAGQRAGMRVVAVTTTHRGPELRTPWIVSDLGSIRAGPGGSHQGPAELRLQVTCAPSS